METIYLFVMNCSGIWLEQQKPGGLDRECYIHHHCIKDIDNQRDKKVPANRGSENSKFKKLPEEKRIVPFRKRQKNRFISNVNFPTEFYFSMINSTLMCDRIYESWSPSASSAETGKYVHYICFLLHYALTIQYLKFVLCLVFQVPITNCILFLCK